MKSKYVSIYEQLASKIESKEIMPGDYLPSEKELMSIYDASRDTIRKSLVMLKQAGYIQKTKGKGSIVIDIHQFEFPISGITSFKEISQSISGDVSTEVVCFEIMNADKNLSGKLNINLGDKIYYIERVRKVDGEAIILDIDVINAGIVPGLTKEIAKDSIYDYIENELGLKISFAKKEISVQTINNLDKMFIDLRGFDMMAVVESYTYLDDASLFQYTISRHRPDRFKFREFARRDKNV
ncbi:MAG: trehalose operon repressor [Erysipelotrichaceae bacterium]|nr:trehalose operon repressor [Erysipelotrichaceae bacterium]